MGPGDFPGTRDFPGKRPGTGLPCTTARTGITGNRAGPGQGPADADHGMSGIAGDGEAVLCEDNDGWRWEPA
jgi:hypothetical protein